MKEYGMIIGQSKPGLYEFNIVEPDYRPVNYEYVQVETEEIQPDGSKMKHRVLGQVKSLVASHPFYDQRTSPGAAWRQRELGISDEMIQVIATAKVLGYLHEERGRREVRRPRSPPMPGTPVYRADDDLLQQLFTLPDDELPLDVGHLLHRQHIKIPVSGRELHRHTAVLAMTRYGKSYFAGRLMEELLKHGATILTIDAHGDYANMVQDPSKKLHPFFRDKVQVFRPETAEYFEGSHVKTLRLSISGCSLGELCALAQVQGSLQRIILSRVLRKVKSRTLVYSLDDIINELYDNMPEKATDVDRVARIITYLENLRDQQIFTEGDLDIREFFQPMKMNDIYLSGISDNVQDVLVGMILRRVFNIKFRREPWARLPIFIFVEEAHRFASPPDEGGGRFSRDILARIAAEGAKFGVFLTVISQRPRRIDPDILSNCSNLAILRVVNSQDQRTIQAASESFSEDLLDDLPALEQGEAVLVGPFVPIPVMIRSATRETRHGGTTPDIYGLLRDAKEQVEEVKEKENRKLY
jgi:DNA helicase HerA-like ATPase